MEILGSTKWEVAGARDWGSGARTLVGMVMVVEVR